MNRIRIDTWPRPAGRARAAAALVALVLALAPAPGLAAATRALVPGDRLPPLRGDLLSGRRFVMPDSAQGGSTLLLLGFTYESRHDVERWAERFQREHERDPRVRFLEVPVIGTAGRLGRPFIDGSMRRGLPRPMHDRVLMVYRDAGLWKRLAAVTDPDVAYLLLVGPDGHVRWRGQGPYDESAWLALSARLAELAAE